jgi:hypothetical protein
MPLTVNDVGRFSTKAKVSRTRRPHAGANEDTEKRKQSVAQLTNNETGE